jgi:NTP pyrophosphatase (non-canonical NTP hydrolase)
MNPDADDKELKIYAKGMKGNYTKGEACDKIDQMVQLQTEAIEMINLERPRNVVKLESTVKEETVEEIKPIEFTREQDLYLLINWHSMSIDDAREYFRMPYYLLAKRLELVLDSTEPYHIELLMEATEAINKRKREEDAITNAGFWRRRKLRKRQKKVAKLEKKLKSMRGE